MRMGTCKALLPYKGSVFVDRVINAARSAVDEVALLGGAELSTPESVGMLRLPDEPNSGGPLAGLVPLLDYAGDRWALLIACDMPLIQSGILERLLDARDVAVDAVAFRVSGADGAHLPCCAAFHPRVVSTTGPLTGSAATARPRSGCVITWRRAALKGAFGVFLPPCDLQRPRRLSAGAVGDDD